MFTVPPERLPHIVAENTNSYAFLQDAAHAAANYAADIVRDAHVRFLAEQGPGIFDQPTYDYKKKCRTIALQHVVLTSKGKFVRGDDTSNKPSLATEVDRLHDGWTAADWYDMNDMITTIAMVIRHSNAMFIINRGIENVSRDKNGIHIHGLHLEDGFLFVED